MYINVSKYRNTVRLLLDIRRWPDDADAPPGMPVQRWRGGGECRPGAREPFYSSLESADFAWGAFFVCIWKLAI